MVSAAELKQKTVKELSDSLHQVQVKLGKARFDLKQNNLKNSNAIKVNRRTIAQILTELKAREMAATK